MSDIDHFIEEVTEEVRRDRMFALVKRYGWIAGLAVLGIVGGAAWNEWTKARDTAAAQALGDQITAALESDASGDRAVTLAALAPASAGGKAVVDLMVASARAASEDIPGAVTALEQVASNGALPEIYRQVAAFKSVLLQADSLSPADRRLRLEALAQPGSALRLLAEEQLALVDLAEGDTEAAIARLEKIRQDAEASSDLQQRAAQVIVALGGTPQPLPGQG